MIQIALLIHVCMVVQRMDKCLLYFPDSIEIAFVEGLTLCCPEINQSKNAVGIVMKDFHGLKKMIFHHVAGIAYF